MKKIKLMPIVLAIMLFFTACAGKVVDDKHNDAYAFVYFSTGNSRTLPAKISDSVLGFGDTAAERAINFPYRVSMEDGVTATICFNCTACRHTESYEDVTAPNAFFFECKCGDVAECLAINLVLNSPPAEEATEN